MDSSVLHAEIASKEKIELTRIDREFNLETYRITQGSEQEHVRLNLTSQRLSSGWLSMIFGTEAEKSGNIAGIVILILLVIMIFLLTSRADIDLYTGDAWSSSVSILTLALGYIFGRGSRNSKPSDRSSN